MYAWDSKNAFNIMDLEHFLDLLEFLYGTQALHSIN